MKFHIDTFFGPQVFSSESLIEALGRPIIDPIGTLDVVSKSVHSAFKHGAWDAKLLATALLPSFLLLAPLASMFMWLNDVARATMRLIPISNTIADIVEVEDSEFLVENFNAALAQDHVIPVLSKAVYIRAKNDPKFTNLVHELEVKSYEKAACLLQGADVSQRLLSFSDKYDSNALIEINEHNPDKAIQQFLNTADSSHIAYFTPDSLYHVYHHLEEDLDADIEKVYTNLPVGLHHRNDLKIYLHDYFSNLEPPSSNSLPYTGA